MVFNYYVEKMENRTVISDVNVNVTFSKTKKDMNIKKEQHIPLISQYFSKKRDLKQVISEYGTPVSVLQFIKN